MLFILFQSISIAISHDNIKYDRQNHLFSSDCPSIPPNNDFDVISSKSSTKFSNKLIYSCQQEFLSKSFKFDNCILQIYRSNFTNANSEDNALYFYLGTISSQLLGNVEINDCRFLNYYSKIGGAIYISSIDATRSIIISNSFFTSSISKISEKGGALFINAISVTIENTKFIDCNSEYGGAIFYTVPNINQFTSNKLKQIPIKIHKCTFNNSNAIISGGSIYFSIEKFKSSRPIEVISCTFNSCSTQEGNGGGIFIKSSNSKSLFKIIECNFGQCSSLSKGGAIYFNALSGSIKRCIFSNNKARDGDDLYYSYDSEDIVDSEKLIITANKFLKKVSNHEEGSVSSLIFTSFCPSSKLVFTHNHIRFEEPAPNLFVFNYPDDIKLVKGQIKLACNTISPSDETRIESKKLISSLINLRSAFNFITGANLVEYNEAAEVLAQTCPEQDGYLNLPTGDDLIVSLSSKDYYVCDKTLTNSYDMKNCNLKVYYCNFNDYTAEVFNLATTATETNNKDTIISGCNFFNCQLTSIKIKSTYNKGKYEIVDCRFEKSAPINFEASNVNIAGCYFIDSISTDVSIAASIICKPSVISNSENKVTISSNTFKRSSESGKMTVFVHFVYSPSSTLEFKFNKFFISVEPSLSFHVFSCETSATEYSGWQFESNCIHPYDDELIKGTNAENLPIDDFESCYNSECDALPDDYTDKTRYYFDCGNVYSTIGGLDASNFVVAIFHCVFYDMTGDNICGIYIHTSKELANQAESTKIYDCEFNGIEGGHGIYIYSDESSRLHDIKNCTFRNIKNNLLKGGAIYIDAKSCSMQIIGCSFSNNYAESGGAVYYDFGTSKFTSNNNEYSLLISECVFEGNIAYSNGGAVCISITNDEPEHPIEISNCQFLNDHGFDDEGDQSGGAIYYQFMPSSDSSLLKDEHSYSFKVIDCAFIECYTENNGGAIYITIENRKPTKLIEINHCSFDQNSVKISTENEGIGGDIYYKLNPNNVENNNYVFNIIDCNFSKSNANYQGGSIYTSISNDRSTTKGVEIIDCGFYNCEPNCEALYMSSTSPQPLFKLSGCEFDGIKSVYFNAIKGIIESCNFYNTAATIAYICNTNSATTTDDQSFRINNCTFITQESDEIDYIIQLTQKSGAKFHFEYNTINITNDKTCLFDAVAQYEDNKGTWKFKSNTIDPARERFIKTERAKSWPPSCTNGFMCEITPSIAFSESSPFSYSKDFSESLGFTASGAFSKTEMFSQSNKFNDTEGFSQSKQFSSSMQFSGSDAFSQTKLFSSTADFSESMKFSLSHPFNDSEYFTQSRQFSMSNEFSETGLFSHTEVFSSSAFFSQSEAFSSSAMFSQSMMFSQSNQFNETEYFSQSKQFSKTGEFSGSALFSLTAEFSQSGQFSQSVQFSQSKDFSVSSMFTQSGHFSGTSMFSGSAPFSSTAAFSNTLMFSASAEFSVSSQFSQSEKFSASKGFSQTTMFSSSDKFTITGQFSQSNQFSKSNEFSTSFFFSQSNSFSETGQFSRSKDFSMTDYFSKTTEFTLSGQFSKSSDFSQSKQFSPSSGFSTSMMFSESDIFSNTGHFSRTTIFSLSSHFSETNLFSSSQPFSTSSGFSTSAMFSESDIFSKTDHFSRTTIFSLSSHFSETNLFSSSQPFSTSSGFSTSMMFSASDAFSKTVKFSHSVSFTESIKFTESHTYSKSDFFTNTDSFTFSGHFSRSEKFTVSHNFSPSTDFSKSQGFSNSEQFSESYQFTPSVTLEPLMPSCAIVDANSNTTMSDRCEYTAPNGTKVTVEILATNFTDYIKEDEDGAAIRIINCEFNCNGTKFINCVSSRGCGGGVYIKNNFGDIQNNITFIDTYFIECSAVYGGAVYVYSSNDENHILFKNCTFEENVATGTKSSKNYGGSSIYLTSRNSDILECVFNRGRGKGGSVKIFDDFEDEDEDDGTFKGRKLLENRENRVSISGCSFDQDRDSIVYLNENKFSVTNVDVTDCDFKGKLVDGAHYIDGKLADKKNPRFNIQSCRFEYNLNVSVNAELIKESNGNEVKKPEPKSLTSIPQLLLKKLVTLSLWSGLFILVVVGIMKLNINCRNNNNYSDDNLGHSLECKESL